MDSTQNSLGEDLQAVLQRGIALQARGDLAGAALAFREVLRRDASSVAALYALSCIEYALQNYPAALSLIAEAIQRLPGYAESYCVKGAILTAQGEFEAAEQAYREALVQDPQNARALQGRNQILEVFRQQECYRLVDLSEMEGFQVLSETPPSVQQLYLAPIVGLSLGGQISVPMPGDRLCSLQNVVVRPYSDFIRGGNRLVSCQKLFRKEYNFLTPRDSDLVSWSGAEVILWKTPSVLEVESAFFLFSTWNNQWAHFLSELYPRLAFLDRLPTDRPIYLPVLESLDPHILALIESRTAQYPQVQLLPIDARTAVRARTLYHVELGTFLGNAGTFQSPFSIQISDSTNAFWKQTLSPAEGSSPAPRSGKLFIGRSGGRSLKNYEAVRSFFVAQGFEEVFPHRLSYAEKVALFRNATHVAGPLSSGFTNVVYCYPQISVLVLANVQRDADTLFTGFCKLMGHKLWFMTGIDSDLRDVNSDYTIDMNVLQTFFHSTFAPKAQGGSLV